MLGLNRVRGEHLGEAIDLGAGGPSPPLALPLKAGKTASNGHPHLETPNLDAMAADGLRFERFYAAAPNCSPTRASFLTGRHPFRCNLTGVRKPLPLRERTIAQLAQKAGYRTAFFGKWHLDFFGKWHLEGGAKTSPVAADDPNGSGHFGFDHWLAASSWFDLDAELGTPQETVKTEGDTSDFLVDQAIDFMRAQLNDDAPVFMVIWYPSPHHPHIPLPKDLAPYEQYGRPAAGYGEIAGIDRSIGTLRAALREFGVADNTLLFYCSDNGGVIRGEDGTFKLSTGGLRGHKGVLYEGGIRVPGIIEWPSRIPTARTTSVPACTSDLYPTLSELFGVELEDKPHPIDGISILPLIDDKMSTRPTPIAFWFVLPKPRAAVAMVDNEWKYFRGTDQKDQLYHLGTDSTQTNNLAEQEPERVARMRDFLSEWTASVERSRQGADY